MDAEINDEGQIVDFLDGGVLADRPEERVRQRYLRILHYEHGYAKEVMDREVAIYYGRNPLTDAEGKPRKADIAIYEDQTAKMRHDQGRIRFVVETKAPDEESGHAQLVSYIFNTSANGAVWYNGLQVKYYRRFSVPENKLVAWPGIPRPGTAWDSVGHQSKAQLIVPSDIKGLLRRCHNRIHRRGAAGDDVTLDMVRILIAKCRDEEKPGPAEFYCTPEEYDSSEGRQNVAKRVQDLFAEFRDANRLVFDEHERISVGPDSIAEVVSELQHYRLVSDDERQWDIMGAVYEEYTADELKEEGGEFFTNRLVVNLLVNMLDPSMDDTVLDPAGGTGGFCTAALRHMRRKIRVSSSPEGVKKRLIEQAADHVFYIDIKHRLVKIAKTAMLLTGDGHQGCIQGDSLGPIEGLQPSFLERCRPGAVTKVLTNPPFAGLVNGRITDDKVLIQFELGKEWKWQGNRYQPTGDIAESGSPPETLFLERCVSWLQPGGILGIVQPKGVLDTTEFGLATRHFIFRKCKVLALINCHKNTFQPYTGSRTTLLVLQKKEHETEFGDDADYRIFMAVSRKIGQDSEGEPIFRPDDEGKPTAELDHDLDAIHLAWLKFRQGKLKESEYVFQIRKSQIDPTSLIINPQRFLPSLNESLRQALRLGDREGWSVSTVGELAQKVYKGGRFKREDLQTEVRGGSEVKEFYTPAALLQEHGENVKLLDLGKASERRKRYILRHTMRRGQILVTRSGTIGRLIYTTDAHDGHIGSDDLIRVEIADEPLRFYVLGFLKTKLGQDQMKRNEYGTIQQHLEPRHVREIVVPIPDDTNIIKRIASGFKEAIDAKERAHGLEAKSLVEINGLHVLNSKNSVGNSNRKHPTTNSQRKRA